MVRTHRKKLKQMYTKGRYRGWSIRNNGKKQYEELKEAMQQINDYEATRQATYDLQIIGQIYRKDMGEFLQFLSDENGKSFQKLCENDFNESG